MMNEEQARRLNKIQQEAQLHPLTCPNDRCRQARLVAGRESWRCPSCTYIKGYGIFEELMLKMPLQENMESRFLLEQQKPDGQWLVIGEIDHNDHNTICEAAKILNHYCKTIRIKRISEEVL